MHLLRFCGGTRSWFRRGFFPGILLRYTAIPARDTRPKCRFAVNHILTTDFFAGRLAAINNFTHWADFYLLPRHHHLFQMLHQSLGHTIGQIKGAVIIKNLNLANMTRV